MFSLIIHNKKENKYFAPAVHDGMTVDWTISGEPGKLAFTVHKDTALNFIEGDVVQLKVGDTPFFYGYVFVKRSSKDSCIEVVAYDQLRYLKNKDSLTYTNKTATEVISMLGQAYQLKLGELADTKFVIDKRNEDNVTLFDMIQTALDITLIHKKELYVLYDEFNKLMLKTPKDMVVPILIDNETAEDFDYESSIDKDTYNLIKLVLENKQTGLSETYYSPADPDEYAKSETKKQWGVLQYYEKLDKNAQNPQEMANQRLAFYNVPRRKLAIKSAFGDARVRAGSQVYVKLQLDDMELAQKMLVTKVQHSFENNTHTMDLALKGGLINDQ